MREVSSGQRKELSGIPECDHMERLSVNHQAWLHCLPGREDTIPVTSSGRHVLYPTLKMGKHRLWDFLSHTGQASGSAVTQGLQPSKCVLQTSGRRVMGTIKAPQGSSPD